MMGSNLTFRHGVITTESASGKILIQNYSNLKLEGVTLKGGPHTAYTLSNNNGNVTIGAGTNIYAGGASPKAAFDVCRFADYESVVVTVEKGAGEIVGVIETSVSGGATGKGPIGLNINGGNLSKATLVCDGESAGTIKVVKDPSVALAAPDGHEWVGGTLVKPSEKAVAAVVKPSGDVVTFAKLAAALAAADGATVQLLTDVTESVVIPAGKVATLDLAGHKITNVAGKHTITNKGELTVVDSASGGVVDNVSHGRAALVTEEGSVTVLSGGTFKRSAEVGTLEPNSGNGNSYYTVLNRGDLTLKAGSRVELLLADGKPAGFSSVVDNGWYSGKPEKDGYVARLTVDGGVIEGGKYIKNDSYGVMVIKSGEVKNGANAAILNWNDLTITGGTIDPSDGAKGSVFNLMGAKGFEDGKVVVSGGTFVSTGDQRAIFTDNKENTSNDAQVSGGTYEGAIPNEDYIVPGFGLNKNPDGSFGVHKHVLVEVAEVPATCDKDRESALEVQGLR